MQTLGADTVYYATRLRGASNEKAGARSIFNRVNSRGSN
jgi:hypothetical protein